MRLRLALVACCVVPLWHLACSSDSDESGGPSNLGGEAGAASDGGSSNNTGGEQSDGGANTGGANSGGAGTGGENTGGGDMGGTGPGGAGAGGESTGGTSTGGSGTGGESTGGTGGGTGGNDDCGNGTLQTGEACDDGNQNESDACGNDCHFNVVPRKVRLAAGGIHTCSLDASDELRCWGRNGLGQLGLGDTNDRGDQEGEMGSLLLPVSLGTGRYPVAISAGGQHSCALLDNASLKCWGYNSYGQLGLGNAAHRGDGAGEMGASLPAVALGTGRTVIDVDAGGNHTCALLDNGAVKCWGNGYSGRLGHGSITHLGDVAAEMGDALLPVSLGAGRTAVDVSAGDMHSCALLDNDTIKCWGANDYGELGLGNTDVRGTSLAQMGDNLPAVDLGPGAAPVAITSGDEHVCALLADGAVKCWGHNDYGQLGIGTDLDVGDAAGEMGASLAAVSLGTGRIAVEITAGYSHTCALLDDGSVKCWGNGAAGQIGQGDTTYRGDEPDEMGDALLPVKLGTGRTAVTVSAGGDHTCARLDDGKVKCWGSNVYGNLGLGHTQNMGNAASEVGDGLPAVDVP